jgi:hypothetical protein
LVVGEHRDLLDVHDAVDLHELLSQLSIGTFLATFFFFPQLRLEFILLPFKLCITDLNVFAVLFQQLFFFLQQFCLLFIEQSNLGIPLCGHFLFLESQSLSRFPILLNLLLCDFLPLLKKFDIILLSLLLNEFVVLVHLSHQSNVPLVHLLHIFFDFDDVLLRKLDGH